MTFSYHRALTVSRGGDQETASTPDQPATPTEEQANRECQTSEVIGDPSSFDEWVLDDEPEAEVVDIEEARRKGNQTLAVGPSTPPVAAQPRGPRYRDFGRRFAWHVHSPHDIHDWVTVRSAWPFKPSSWDSWRLLSEREMTCREFTLGLLDKQTKDSYGYKRPCNGFGCPECLRDIAIHWTHDLCRFWPATLWIEQTKNSDRARLEKRQTRQAKRTGRRPRIMFVPCIDGSLDVYADDPGPLNAWERVSKVEAIQRFLARMEEGKVGNTPSAPAEWSLTPARPRNTKRNAQVYRSGDMEEWLAQQVTVRKIAGARGVEIKELSTEEAKSLYAEALGEVRLQTSRRPRKNTSET